MALIITNENGTLFFKGCINSSTSESCRNHLLTILNKKKPLVINMEAVTKIDTSGLLALYKIYKRALVCNLEFKITGRGRKDIYRALKIPVLA